MGWNFADYPRQSYRLLKSDATKKPSSFSKLAGFLTFRIPTKQGWEKILHSKAYNALRGNHDFA